MKFVYSLVMLSCVLWEARGYPYYPSYGNTGTLSYGGAALSRYYNTRAAGGSMAAYMVRQPAPVHQKSSRYHLADRRRQALEDTNLNIPPQENNGVYPQEPEVLYPQQPDNQAFVPNEATEFVEPTEKIAEVAPTVKAVAIPEVVEPEIEEVPEEEPVPKPKKTVPRKKQVKRPIDDEDEEEYNAPKIPTGAYFPMFFGYGGRSGGGNGPTAISNSFSTGRGGVSTSHATAYGGLPKPQERS